MVDSFATIFADGLKEKPEEQPQKRPARINKGAALRARYNALLARFKELDNLPVLPGEVEARSQEGHELIAELDRLLRAIGEHTAEEAQRGFTV